MEIQPPRKHVHQITRTCVTAASHRSLSLLTTRHVIHVLLENLVPPLESVRIVPQVGTRTQQEVSNARHVLRDSRKSREERLSAIHAAQARSPTKHRLSSATTVHRATTQTVMRVQAASSAFQVPFKMKRKKAHARNVKLVSSDRPTMHPLTACHVREAGIKILRSRRRVYHAFQVPTMMRKDESSASFVIPARLLMALLSIRAKTVSRVKSQ